MIDGTRRALLGWLAAIVAAAMPVAATPAAAQAKPPLTVFAAASLTNALTEIGKAYTAKTGQPVRFSFASSGVIARQIEAGAKADLFFSADTEWMDYVQTRGLIDPASRRDLLRGRLALIAPVASMVQLKIRPGFPIAAALGEKGRLSTGDPDSVPAGRYARAALTKLGVWPTVADRLARADNVRVALTYVARGEAPLGIVYETDAAIEPGVRVVGIFPENSHAPIVYPVAVTKVAGDGARDFYRFATGPAARAIYAKYKFLAVGR